MAGLQTPITCTELSYLTIVTEVVRSESLVEKLLRTPRSVCGIKASEISKVLNALERKEYVKANERLLNILTTKHFNTTARFVRVAGDRGPD